MSFEDVEDRFLEDRFLEPLPVGFEDAEDGFLFEDAKDGFLEPLPVGWRFDPTDEELIDDYLRKKKYLSSVVARVIRDISARQFYSRHPKDLVEGSKKREWYFFIHNDGTFQNSRRPVRDGWRRFGEEEPIYDADGRVYAFKIYCTYYCKDKKTYWRMEQLRLRPICEEEEDGEAVVVNEWVVARITRGQRYETRF